MAPRLTGCFLRLWLNSADGFRNNRARGHIIDSLILPKVLDQILTRGASFIIVEFNIGQKRVDQSFARIEVISIFGKS